MYLATFASLEKNSIGRAFQERNSPSFFGIYQQDRDRIIHSTAFRRLEYKTQVFVNYVGDHYRNRLTHSLEVAQIARAVARELKLHEDLSECIALSHDLGHPPFGHAGEEALQEITEHIGGFNHNVQTLRILMIIEKRHAGFNGLNLSWETLEGIAKHNGPISSKSVPIDVYKQYLKINKEFDLNLETFGSLESQIASLADDIAYLSHDIDDGLRSNLIAISDLKKLPLLGEIFAYIDATYRNLEPQRLQHEAISRLVKYMMTDLINQTRKNIASHKINLVADIRHCNAPIAEFSGDIKQLITELKSFLMERIYHHTSVRRMVFQGKLMITKLFEHFIKYPEHMPQEWYSSNVYESEQIKIQQITDYIAGMTDRYLIKEYQQLFESKRS